MAVLRMSRKEYQAIARKTAAKKSRREDNAKFINKMKRATGQTVIACLDKTSLKKAIVKLLGLLDKKINGPRCRLGAECPDFKKYGPHDGEAACHIISQKRGGAAQLEPLGIYWGCHDANFGEMMNRDLYRQIHIRVFGKERVEWLEAKAREKVHYTVAYLRELRDRIKSLLEAK